jgi:site-specific recombinase XerD
MVNNVIGVVNYVIAARPPLLNFMIADSRTLELPGIAADALRALHARQAADRLSAGALWRDHGLVFCTRIGTPLGASNVRRSLRSITKAAKIGERWTPRELRHSFVSIMSDHGVSIEAIADLVGHKNSTVTARVYRHQIRPVIAQGAETMDTIFSQRKEAKSA